MKNGSGFNLKELAGGDDGARTRDLMRDRHVKTIAGVDSKGPWLAADGPFCPSFSLVCGPDVAHKFATQLLRFFARGLSTDAVP